MTADQEARSDPYNPDTARRNRTLGFILGGLVLLVVLVFMWRFSDIGLPPDRTMIEENEQRSSATEEEAAAPAEP